MKTPDEQPALPALILLLDDALLALREKDRTALLLRYYEGQSLSEVGASLGVGEDAARKRVQGALENLSQLFQRRGFKTATVAASAAALEHTAVSAPATTVSNVVNAALQAAPPALAGLTALLARLAGLMLAQKVALFLAVAAALLVWQWSGKPKVEKADMVTRPQWEVSQSAFLRPRESPTQPFLGLADTIPSVALSRNDVIPPFVAEGHLSTHAFRTERTNLNYETEANVVFIYSNGWWQLEVRFAYRDKGVTNVYNCMRIPDGTRTFSSIGSGTAEACPNSFPPPGRPELLVPWLSLCPHPELPLIDNKRMRRFINLPNCRPDVFNLPQNEGYYGVQYLNPGNAFISELTVTNNGYGIDLNVVQSGGVEGEITRFAGPFENGYMDLLYNILETTNVNGLTFPLRTVYKRFTPNWGGKHPDDLRVGLLSELTIKRITISEREVSKRRSAHSKRVAYDMRAPNLPKEEAFRYTVTDDQWKPLSDPEIQSGFRRLKEAGN